MASNGKQQNRRRRKAGQTWVPKQGASSSVAASSTEPATTSPSELKAPPANSTDSMNLDLGEGVAAAVASDVAVNPTAVANNQSNPDAVGKDELAAAVGTVRTLSTEQVTKQQAELTSIEEAVKDLATSSAEVAREATEDVASEAVGAVENNHVAEATQSKSSQPATTSAEEVGEQLVSSSVEPAKEVTQTVASEVADAVDALGKNEISVTAEAAPNMSSEQATLPQAAVTTSAEEFVIQIETSLAEVASEATQTVASEGAKVIATASLRKRDKLRQALARVFPERALKCFGTEPDNRPAQ